MRGIEVYHVQGNGWNDIGYNFLVDRFGTVYEGRAGGMTRNVIGAHSLGLQHGHGRRRADRQLHCARRPPPAEQAALVSLLAWRLDVAHVDPLSQVVDTSRRQRDVPRRQGRHAARDLGPPRHRPDRVPRQRTYALLPSLAKRVAQTGLPKLYSVAASGAPRRPDPLPGAALLDAAVDGHRHRRERQGGRERRGPRHARRLDVELGQGGQGAVPLAHGRRAEGLPAQATRRAIRPSRRQPIGLRPRRRLAPGAEARSPVTPTTTLVTGRSARPRRSRRPPTARAAPTVSFIAHGRVTVTVTVAAAAAGLPLLRSPAQRRHRRGRGRRHPRERPLQARRLGDAGGRGHAGGRPST